MLFKWIRRITLGGALLCVIALYFYWIFPFWGMPFNGQRHTQVPLTPSWALEPWLWEDDVNTAEEVLKLLDGYEKHDIPARTILIDSPWTTRYNDFQVDETRYPEPEKFFKGLQDRGYRVVLWMTPQVNSKSKDTALPESEEWYAEARDKGYLAGDGHQVKWWKGTGGFIDYTNPTAMTWWRGLQQNVFDWGIDGWKLDGSATYFSSNLFGKLMVGYQRTHAGWMTTRGYMDHYYRDEYQHGLTQNPEFITLSRALDRQNLILQHPEGFSPFDSSPVNWVGDQDHTWTEEEEGIEEALRDILNSAKMGYNVIGSDIGGYGGGTIPPKVYIRWAQFSTFCGLFLNGGHGERALWERSEEELEIIRKFAWLHKELLPYIYTHMKACHEGGEPLMRPAGVEYEYFFGPDFYVAPIHSDSDTHTVHLPEGSWRYFFDPTEVIEGPSEITRDFPLDEAPVYVRDGAVIPMRVSRDYTGFGDRESEGALTLVVYPGESDTTIFALSAKGDAPKVVSEEGVADTLIETYRGEDGVSLRINSGDTPVVARFVATRKPAAVLIDDVPMSDSAWRFDDEKQVLVIRADKATPYTIEVRH